METSSGLLTFGGSSSFGLQPRQFNIGSNSKPLNFTSSKSKTSTKIKAKSKSKDDEEKDVKKTYPNEIQQNEFETNNTIDLKNPNDGSVLSSLKPEDHEFLKERYKQEVNSPKFDEQGYNNWLKNSVLGNWNADGISTQTDDTKPNFKQETKFEGYEENKPYLVTKDNMSENSPQTYAANAPTLYSDKQIDQHNVDLKTAEANKGKTPEAKLSDADKIIQEFIDNNERNKTMGIVGAGTQALSAAASFISNSNQPHMPRPAMVIGSHLPYNPIDTTSYDKKLDENISEYKKHLTESGNSHLIPSLIGMEDKRNEMYANVSNANNQDKARVDAANANNDMTTQQINSGINNEYTKSRMQENAMRDASKRSNMNLFFNSIGGIGSNIAAADEQTMQAKLIKNAIKNKDTGLFESWFDSKTRNKMRVNLPKTTQTSTETE